MAESPINDLANQVEEDLENALNNINDIIDIVRGTPAEGVWFQRRTALTGLMHRIYQGN